MRATSYNHSSKAPTQFSGNAPIFLRATLGLNGVYKYDWNPRFVYLFNAVLKGDKVPRITDHSKENIDLFVSYANGKLSSNDPRYNRIAAFNQYLATI